MWFAETSGHFQPGQLTVTPGVLASVPRDELQAAFCRHLICDWGELCDTDKQANDRALVKGGRLLSAYRAQTGVKFWIITEADRSATTILLPEEY